MKTAKEYAEEAAELILDLAIEHSSDGNCAPHTETTTNAILNTIPLESLVKCAEAAKELKRFPYSPSLNRKFDEALAELDREDAK